MTAARRPFGRVALGRQMGDCETVLDAIIELADRPANELTRRDVARYLLTLSSSGS